MAPVAHPLADFNVAAALQPRKGLRNTRTDIPFALLQCGRGSSAAESQHSRPVRSGSSPTSMWPRLFSRGKELTQAETIALSATSMWPRLFSRGKGTVHLDSTQKRHTSMWPRLFSRGKGVAPVYVVVPKPNFNVAAALQPRKVGYLWRLTCQPLHFNVAAALQPRKGEHIVCCRGVVVVLQCGRGSSAAESEAELARNNTWLNTSMWPRLFSRGKVG